MADTSSARRRTPIQGASQYEWVSAIAKGGLGTVDLVLRREGSFRRLYALKRLRAHLRDDDEIRQMFLDEARLAGLLHHPNVVGVLDVGEDEEGPFLLMEYIDGISLSRLLRTVVKRGDLLPLGVGLRIVKQTAQGLRAAHELKTTDGRDLTLVHRDISPQNLLVDFDGVVRVVDFGIAKAIGGEGQSTTQALRGKFGYMAPEQLRFEKLDARADLFSLGVVTWELLAGRRLYPGKRLDEVARRVMHEPPPELAPFRGDCPPSLERLLFRLLAKDKDERVASAAELLGELDAVIAEVEDSEGTLDVRTYMAETFGALRETLRADREAAIERATQQPPQLKLASEPAPRRAPSRAPLIAAITVGVLLGAGALFGLQRFFAEDPEPPVTTATPAEVTEEPTADEAGEENGEEDTSREGRSDAPAPGTTALAAGQETEEGDAAEEAPEASSTGATRRRARRRRREPRTTKRALDQWWD